MQDWFLRNAESVIQSLNSRRQLVDYVEEDQLMESSTPALLDHLSQVSDITDEASVLPGSQEENGDTAS